MARMNGAALPAEQAQALPFAENPAFARLRLIFYAWLPIVTLIAAWEIFSRSGLVTQYALPSFSSCILRIIDEAASGDLTINLGLTLYRTFAGFVIATALGVIIGIGIARHPLTKWFFDPIVSVAFPMPKIAFLPIIVLWLGFFDASKISMVAFSTIFPIITTTMLAVQGVKKELIWSAESLGTPRRRMLWDVILPASLPQVMTGLQVALPIALIVTIITEMTMSGYGLGGAMQRSAQFANSRGVFAGIIETTIIGYLMIKSMSMLRRRLLAWHQEALDPTTA
ncbi:MAG: ABC transporter permease [Rhodospirillales bacterium]|nr:ABC transporter permease [Rhodospirillales bacterium]